MRPVLVSLKLLLAWTASSASLEGHAGLVSLWKGSPRQHLRLMKNATRLGLSRASMKRLVGLTLIVAGMSLLIEGVRAVLLP